MKKMLSEKKSPHAWYGYETIFTMVSGSHLYGFSSKNSDIDIRGCFIYDSRACLGLYRPTKTMNVEDGLRDIEMKEVALFVGLLVKANCNIHEQISADPLWVPNKMYYSDLQRIADVSLTADGLYNSYRGMALYNYKKYIAARKKPTAKKWLYVIRALLAGTFVLSYGIIEPNLNQLKAILKLGPDYDTIEQLINLKRTSEHVPIEQGSTRKLKDLYRRCLDSIDLAFRHTDLPKKLTVSELQFIDEKVIDMRLDYLKRIKESDINVGKKRMSRLSGKRRQN
jgi:predicted nucleotidyltransferase